VLAKDKQIMLLIRHLPCYSYYSEDVVNTTVHKHTKITNIRFVVPLFLGLSESIFFHSKGTVNISTFFCFNIILHMKTL
jgi:hypothetical protein